MPAPTRRREKILLVSVESSDPKSATSSKLPHGCVVSSADRRAAIVTKKRSSASTRPPASVKKAASALVGNAATETVKVEIVPAPGQTFKKREGNIEVVPLTFKGNRAQQDVASPGSYRLQWRVWGAVGMEYSVAITAPKEAEWNDTFRCDPTTGFDSGLKRFDVKEDA
jgi:hypothetical protein